MFKNLFFCFSLGVALLATGSTVIAQSSPVIERVVADFEGQDRPHGWRATAGEVKLAVIADPTRSGGRSNRVLRLDFPEIGWRRAQLGLSADGTGLWEGWDTFEFDIYNDSDHAVLVRLRLEAGRVPNGFYNDRFTLEPKQWYRYTMSARHFPGRTAQMLSPRVIDSFSLLGDPNHPFPQRTLLYLDNLRLTHRAGERISQLQALMRHATHATEQVSGEEEGDGRELERTLQRLRQQFTGARRSPEVTALESLSMTTSQVQRAVHDHLDQRLGHLFHQILREEIELPQMQEPGVPATLLPITRDRRSEAELQRERDVRVLDQMAGKLQQFQTSARQAAAWQRAYGSDSLAIGVPSMPQVWPQGGYDGPIGGRVQLQAAGNEYEPFQLVVLAGGEALQDVSVIVSDLVGPGRITQEHIEVAPMGWRQEVGGPWVADMLRPDIQQFEVAAGEHQPVWVNVYVPEGTPAGDYRGTATVRAKGLPARSIDIALAVWPFSLPKVPSLESATWDNLGVIHATKSDRYLEHARMVIQRRWNANQIYYVRNHADWSPQLMRQLSDLGSRLHNLHRISYRSSSFEEGPDGQRRVTEASKRQFFRWLDPIVEQIRAEDPDLLQHVMIYGYDEPPTSVVPAMDELYGALKERYGPIPIVWATMYPAWERYPEIKNVDIYAVMQRIITPEVLADLQAQGKRVWWYNLYARHRDPVGTRVQYWATFKDGFDGVLHYSLSEAGEGTSPTRPAVSKWGPTLMPPEPRTDGGIKRITEDDRPISTVAFEYWREGMEDVEYLTLLRGLREQVSAASPAPLRALLREADTWLRVPDTVTPGIMGNHAREEGEVVVALHGHTREMAVLMQARREVAELIVRIQEVLGH